MGRAKGNAGAHSGFKPKMCAQVLEIVSKEKVMSLVDLRVELGITKDRMYEWEGAHENFRDAMNLCRDIISQKWQKLGLSLTKGAYGRSASSDAFKFTAKNVTNWRDQYEDLSPSTKIDLTLNYKHDKEPEQEI